MNASSKGPAGNRFKKRDGALDMMPSFKHDTEADIGELFYSRETLKLSYKKGVGQFVRYEDSQDTSSTLPYKVYTALLIQNGPPTEDSANSGLLTTGRTYYINQYSPGMDFTNVGAPNNNLGTAFVATGTTPNSWGSGADYTLAYNAGAPIVKVLENTLDVAIYFEYVTLGNYIAIADKTLFDSPNAYVTISNQAYVAEGNYFAAQALPVFFNVVGITTSENGIPEDSVISNNYVPTILEIRIYNDTII